MANFEKAIPVILAHEGGYVNNPADPGGATNRGVSLRYLHSSGILNDPDLDFDYDGDGDVDADDMKLMPKEDAIKVYRRKWWDAFGYGNIKDQELATKVFDTSINTGARQAHKFLQRAANEVMGEQKLIADGVIGKKTMAAINNLDPKRLLSRFREHQAAFYRELARNNPKSVRFLEGWLRRAAE